MFRHMLILVTFLVVKIAMTTSTKRCQTIISDICFQHCRNRSCDCGVTDSNHSYAECYQACAGSQCMAITCSSKTCYQKCHNCHMECTSDVGYCRQRCLSGACSFKCNARHCEQDCTGGKCLNIDSDNCQLILPLNYLVLLAGFLFAISFLSCMLLVMSFKKEDFYRKRAPYSKLQNFSGSVESLNSLSSVT